MLAEIGQALHPDAAGLGVPMLHAAAGLEDFVGAHGRIAHEDEFVIAAIGAQQVEGGQAGVVSGDDFPPDALVDAIVEIEIAPDA